MKKSIPITPTSKVEQLEARRETALALATDARIRATQAADEGDVAGIGDWNLEALKQEGVAAAFAAAIQTAKVAASAAGVLALKAQAIEQQNTLASKAGSLQADMQSANVIALQLVAALKAIQASATAIDEDTLATSALLPSRDRYRGIVAATSRVNWYVENVISTVLGDIGVKAHSLPPGPAPKGEMESAAAEAMSAQLRDLSAYVARYFAPPEIVEPTSVPAGQAPQISQSSHAVLQRESLERCAAETLEQESLS